MPGYDCCCNDDICCALKRFIGQTVTIFTESGGLSGSGFTGVLVSVDECFVRLITRVGGAPSCPVGSDCGYSGCCGYGYDGYAYGGYGGYGGGYGGYGGYGGRGGKFGHGGGCCYYNPLGSITVIPIESIASFVHNAI